MAPSGHRRNLHPKSSSVPCRGDSSSSGSSSIYKIGRTKHCSVRYKTASARTSHCMQKGKFRNLNLEI